MVSTATTMDLSLIADPVIVMNANTGIFGAVHSITEQPLGFSFSDLRSAERVLTMSSLDLQMAAASADLSITVACCCTPCCCAVAVMQPVSVN